MHERFTPADIRELRENHPGVTVLAHPECPPEVVAEADFSGSTAAMSDYVGSAETAPRRADDGMLDERQCRRRASRGRVHPALQSVPAHEADTLANIRAALEQNRHVVTIEPEIAGRARLAVERMLAV